MYCIHISRGLLKSILQTEPILCLPRYSDLLPNALSTFTSPSPQFQPVNQMSVLIRLFLLVLWVRFVLPHLVLKCCLSITKNGVSAHQHLEERSSFLDANCGFSRRVFPHRCHDPPPLPADVEPGALVYLTGEVPSGKWSPHDLTSGAPERVWMGLVHLRPSQVLLL